ncbi:MAG: 4-hydroxy-3-methylbut-2-en-1-yl diphosphate synthase [Bacteroidetes bacterium RIFCSPLOWO2_12_FULL_37_12]|nr:MAG: 4-hydroxy-3-methylbut-2-en-1-yl diphosphate synthase [Bacteroidetes bacterium RIFCSPLOWO2_12_FULL_37_12]
MITQELILTDLRYCLSHFNYQRIPTRVVKIGDVPLGGDHPIRIQSMTTVDSMDTKGCVDQILRMVESGSEYVRITAPSLNEARNLENIKKSLNASGCHVPLIADIHYTPGAAEIAARIVEKVRINPGNFADKKKFQVLEYTDKTYSEELERIRERFLPLVKICKEHGTALRIGTNHGSLSDRIMSRYGDNPMGMVESALEFIRICEDEGFHDLVLSMKASNPQVMVQAYRLLVNRMWKEKMNYPIHLGVTEAGDGADGRIKSAMGIGSLLRDGIGDTVRVSLTEDPEFEAPVGFVLVDSLRTINRNLRTINRKLKSDKQQSVKGFEIAINNTNGNGLNPNHDSFISETNLFYNPYDYKRRNTHEIINIGGKNVPRVIIDFSNGGVSYKLLESAGHFYSPGLDKWNMSEAGCDYIYLGKNISSFMLPNGLRAIVDFSAWVTQSDTNFSYPLCNSNEYFTSKNKGLAPAKIIFVEITLPDYEENVLDVFENDKRVVFILKSTAVNHIGEFRKFFFLLLKKGIHAPVVLSPVLNTPSLKSETYLPNTIPQKWAVKTTQNYQMEAATITGSLLLDGFGDGILLPINSINVLPEEIKLLNLVSFGILQASRTRIFKTEYISCPSCGRTLFDLQETTSRIRMRTDHLKGLKIAIMGCIVNGPGEMADADYGYVGVGPGKIALYRGKEVVTKSVNAEESVDELIKLIKEDGRWVEENIR